MLKHTKSFVDDERGTTAMEYGLIIACIVMVLFPAMQYAKNAIANSLEFAGKTALEGTK